MYLSNPGIIIALAWFAAFLLHSISLFDFFIIPRTKDKLLIFLFLSLAFIFAILSSYMARSMRYYDSSGLRDCRNLIKIYMIRLLCIYVLISVFDIIYSGGVPVVWFLLDLGKTHADFGIPTVHGLANSALFSYIILWSVLRFSSVDKPSIVPVFFLFLYQIVIASRGSIVVCLIECLCVYLFFNRLSIKRLLGLIILFGLFLFLFGLFGNFRTGFNPYLSSLTVNYEYFSDSFLSVLLWFYAYMTGGLNNVFANTLIDGIGYPFFTLSKIVPSFIYSFLEVEKKIDSFILVVPHLNVSTALSGYISDFGLYGIFFYLWFPLLGSVVFYFARSGSYFALFCLPVFYQAAVHSIFIDTFLYTVFLFQLLILGVIARRISKRFGKKIGS